MKVRIGLQFCCWSVCFWLGCTAALAAIGPQELFARNRFAQARAAYKEELKRHPGDVTLHIGLIRTLFRLDSWQEATGEARDLIRIAPESADAHGLLSLCLMREALPDLAQYEAGRALDLSKDSYWGLVAMGRVQLWDSQRDAAQKTLRDAVACHPDWPEAWSILVEASGDDVTEQDLNDIVAYVKLNPKGHPHEQNYEMLATRIAFIRRFLHDPPYRAISPVTEERLEAASRGEAKAGVFSMPVERQESYVILPIKVDGRDFHVLFDTGGGFELTLDRKAVARLNLQPISNSVVRGVSGAEPTKLYKAEQMTVGDQTFQSIPIEEIGNEIGPFDGIFGVTNLDHYAVTIDFAANRLTLARGKDAAAPEPEAGNRLLTIPFHYLGGDIFVPVKVEGRSVWAVIDTGADAEAILSLRLAREIALSRGKGTSKEAHINARMGIGTSAARQTMLLFHEPVSLALAGNGGQILHYTVKPAYGASPLDEQVSPSGDFEVGAILGISFLASAHRITFDYPHHLLTLELPADRLIQETKR